MIGFGSVLSQALYLTYVEKSGCAEGMSTLTVLYVNSINCVPLLAAISLVTGDLLDCLRNSKM